MKLAAIGQNRFLAEILSVADGDASSTMAKCGTGLEAWKAVAEMYGMEEEDAPLFVW